MIRNLDISDCPEAVPFAVVRLASLCTIEIRLQLVSISLIGSPANQRTSYTTTLVVVMDSDQFKDLQHVLSAVIQGEVEKDLHQCSRLLISSA